MYSLVPVADLYTGKVTGECIKRLADNAFIPLDPANADYQKYLEWLAEGNPPLPPEGDE